MELRVLRYFLTVAREESITGAAKALHVSQPTLSKQLMDLEKKLGQVLLIRGNRKITLTEEGMLLRKRAQEIIDLVDKTEAELHQSDEVISGDVYIGCGETDAMRLIARTVKQMQMVYPYIRYHLFSGNAEDVTERMDKGLLDFGVLIGATEIDKYDYISLSAVDTWGLLMRKDSMLAASAHIKPEALRDIPIICSRQALACNELSGWLGNNLENLNVIATYNLIYNAALMVEEGVGYALGLDKLVNTTEKSSLCFIPLEPRVEAHLHIVWKKHQVFSKAAGAFLKKLQELLALPSK
ncbi:LysR family transcriptional regulator [Sporomusa sphaeroides]|uniref:LysR family transcriptional regulator n=1 Tax=Sporomusa sphaeroides TaxID=47679 RepID=UPI0009529116|nr:LysR family transcriptional regulator [Sporomusa sphaeroides]OLS55867.1 HTH-type transcriptional regulator CysL [Sporomusa sphaeroides DSM 2875]